MKPFTYPDTDIEYGYKVLDSWTGKGFGLDQTDLNLLYRMMQDYELYVGKNAKRIERMKKELEPFVNYIRTKGYEKGE